MNPIPKHLVAFWVISIFWNSWTSSTWRDWAADASAPEHDGVHFEVECFYSCGRGRGIRLNWTEEDPRKRKKKWLRD